MTTFKEISGQLIRTLSSDPANPLEGQIWYNSTIGVLKGYKSLVECGLAGGNYEYCYSRSWSGRNTNCCFSHFVVLVHLLLV
jgi:hypothetical protein